MKDLLAQLGVLSSTLISSHVLPRDEGHIWTTPQDSDNGSFIFPRTYPLTFREDSSINISWSTKFENINLYFYQRGKVANSVQLATNLATEWYQWEVRAAETNLTSPFVFRIVNAHGTTEEQSGGGFWSTSWFLTRDDKSNESTTRSSSLGPSTTATSSMASTPSPTSSKSSSSTTRETKTEKTAAPTMAAEAHNKGVGKSTIIGLTVGLVAAGATIIAGLLYCLRKHQKNSKASSLVPSPDGPYYGETQFQKQIGYYTAHEAFTQPPELQCTPPCYELPSRK